MYELVVLCAIVSAKHLIELLAAAEIPSRGAVPIMALLAKRIARMGVD